jgi:hypothetical protein
VIHIASLDMLIDDGTYYVHEASGEIVDSGGWSRRNPLHAGACYADDDARLLEPRASGPAGAMFVALRLDAARPGPAILKS